MKLLSRYNRITLITTIFVMVIAGIIYYRAVSWILTDKIDDDLVVEENEALNFVKLNHHLPQEFNSQDQRVSFYPAVKGSVTRQFINTDYYNSAEKEYELGRELISAVQVKENFYKIVIVESKVETEDLIRIIFFITAGLILLLLFILLIINRLLLNRLWKPFNAIMKELRLFNITDNSEMQNTETGIEEFKELNIAVINMSLRVKHDYKDLKTFTENASHELLTPIAVINSKLDTLIQTENFSERQSKLLNDLYTAVNRLNRLNQSLLLLVKLENRLKISLTLNNKEIYGSQYLVDILLNNLLINAIRHNHFGGEIIIELTEQCLTISNTGDNAPLASDQIFKRFHKSSGSEGSGLGLTISRQICENLGFRLEYSFLKPYHRFRINFNPGV
jgi:signal transduction histidine kinase